MLDNNRSRRKHRRSARFRRSVHRSPIIDLIVDRLVVHKHQAELLERLSNTLAVEPGDRLQTHRNHAPHWLVGVDVDLDIAFGPANRAGKKAPWVVGPFDPVPADADANAVDVAALTALNSGTVLAVDVRHLHLVERIVRGRAEPVGPVIRALRHLRSTETGATGGRSQQARNATADR